MVAAVAVKAQNAREAAATFAGIVLMLVVVGGWRVMVDDGGSPKEMQEHSHMHRFAHVAESPPRQAVNGK